MLERDAQPFFDMLDEVFGLYPQARTTTDGQKAMFFRALSDQPISAVRKAFDAHVKDPARGRFPPLPADVIAQIEGATKADGRPGPEEAWVIALNAADESKTIVWTEEIAQAWGIAQPAMKTGDDIAARMAFKESYQRLVQEARIARSRPEWKASVGVDASQRDEALKLAYSHGLISAPEKLRELPSPDHGLSMTNKRMPAEVREKLMKLREKLSSAQDAPQNQIGAFQPIGAGELPPGMK